MLQWWGSTVERQGDRWTKADRLAALATGLLVAAALYVAYLRIDRWAATAFAQARLAAMLVAVLDVGVLLVALCLSPPLFRVVRRLVRGRRAAISEGIRR